MDRDSFKERERALEEGYFGKRQQFYQNLR
jgi:hypothetical protein